MDTSSFQKRNEDMIAKMSCDPEMKELTRSWFDRSLAFEYPYHFTWLGIPIIQFPQDILALQEILWEVKPDLIIETGIARGGSLVFYASMLELMDGDGQVLGIDIQIREENRINIESHPLFKRITMFEGSSTDEPAFEKARNMARNKRQILVVLDSMHTHEHVLEELRFYSTLVTKGSYLIVFDTVIEDVPDEANEKRPWGRQNNPKSAVREFLEESDEFVVDKAIEKKLLFTVAPDGFLRRL